MSCSCFQLFRLSMILTILIFAFRINGAYSGEKEVSPSVFEQVLEAMPRILDDLKYLSDDDREGRGPSSRGLDDSADYIRKQFDLSTLTRPFSDPDGLLEFTVNQGASLGKEQSLEFVFADGSKTSAQFNKDFQVSTLGVSGDITADLVFAGYGISSPDKKYDDFAEIDVQGKVAIIFRKVPRHQVKDDLFTKQGEMNPDYAPLNNKIKLLNDRKAAGVILLNDPTSVATRKAEIETEIRVCQENIADSNLVEEEKKKEISKLEILVKELAKSQGDELVAFGYGGTIRGISIPVVHLKLNLCDELFTKTIAKTTTELEQAITQDLHPHSSLIHGLKVNLKTSITPNKTDLKNVIGVLEGEGELKEETIIVGAHYDHVGMGNFGSLLPGSNQVHNGADDNASGTTALLELARNFGKKHQHLPRRIVFIAFSGEELGLLGSADYTAKPVFPLDKTIAMFNLDMVGRVADNKITIFGTKTSTRWEPLLDELSLTHKLNFVRKAEGFGPSDHSSFYKQKIPVLHFFTGLHGDYHRPSDDWEKINAQGIARVAVLLEEIILMTANAQGKPAYVEIPGRANVFNASGTTPFLGTIPNLSYSGPGYKIESLTYDSPAIQAGILAGDIITAIDNHPLVTLEDLPKTLSKFKGDQEVKIQYLRQDASNTAKVTLSKPR